MKRIILFLLILCSLFLFGCDPQFILEADTTNIPETVTQYVTETVIVTETVEVENTEKIQQLENEIEQYKDLIANLNDLLSNVYYGYAENDKYILDGFTAFSISYNDKFYLITAGHAVEDSDGRYYNHKFKSNGEWIYPKLLTYDFGVSGDYAVFYSNKIKSGLNIGSGKPAYYLTHDKKAKANSEISSPGDSGSPVIDLSGKVVGMRIYDTGFYTDINMILKAIDTIQ